MSIKPAFFLLILLALISCRDDTTPLGPVEDVNYTDQIQVIFNQTCGGAGCHIGDTQSGVNLSSYNQVMNSFGLQYELPIVDPGNPDGSPLVDKIEPSPQYGERMPFGGNPLHNRQIEEIRVWIEEGAQNH